ncbi:hypothetical protein KEJ33_04800 [Candidatus Bathyarchaeota archaeon]|nr:hypothetical protein [Candidatus Bathyarchaeota archaeon]
MAKYSFKILSEDKKQVEINYNNKTLRFQLKQKRSFTVLKKLLEAYPNYISIHSLDSILHDPNRAHSDLRNTNGYANFLSERRGEKREMLVKINIPKLFQFVRPPKDGKFIVLARDTREPLSPKDRKEIYQKFKGRCNITGVKVYNKIKGNKFLKSLMLASYDHRRPLSKRGSNELDNWQLLSKLANDEKNKICNTCDGIRCEQCALAYPEKFNIIQPNNQDISELRMRS